MVLLFVAPSATLFYFIFINFVWAGITSIRDVIESDILNQMVVSENRATALSAFNMIKYIPYAFLAALVGYAIDIKGIDLVVYILACTMLILFVISLGYFLVSKK